jgi:hypothetical protein
MQCNRMERVRHPDVSSLEVWDFWVDGGDLWEWSGEPEYPAILRQTLESLWAGEGTTRSHGPVPAQVAGFDAVFFTGGGVMAYDLIEEFVGLPCAVYFGERPVFGAEKGGFDLLQTRGLSGWVADLGQTQLKLVAPGWRWTFPRDRKRLPVAGELSIAETATQRRRLREFIALKLQMAMAEARQRPHAMVFALPALVSDDGTPIGSSYAGMQGDRMLLPDGLQMAGLDDVPLFVLHDAELAALSARLDPRLAGFRKVLVLTLGFGIGAALIHRGDGTLPSSCEKAENKGCSGIGLC